MKGEGKGNRRRASVGAVKRCVALLTLAVLGTAIALGCFGCKSAAPQSGISYKLALDISDDLESVRLEEEVRFPSAGEPSVLNLWANAYRQDAAYPAYFNALPEYGGIEIRALQSNGQEQPFTIDETGEHLTVDHGVPAGEEVCLSILADLDVPHGVYRLGLHEGVLKLFNFYPVLAVQGEEGARLDHFSRIGDPFVAESASYSLSIDCPADLVVAMGAEEIVERESAEGRKRLEGKIEGIRDFVLTASRSYVETKAKAGEVEVSYYALEEKAERAEYAAQILGELSDLLIAYPYSRYVVAEAPFYYGGMEAGAFSLIASDAADLKGTIRHETAHQWFYNLVGSDQINDPWLDEGLTSFVSEYLLLKEGDAALYEESLRAQKKQYNAYVTACLSLDPSFSASMRRPVVDYATNYAYSMIVYTKSVLAFDSLYRLLGAQKLEAALAAYCRANLYALATPDDLFAAFRSAAKQDVQPLLDPWLDDKVLAQSFNLAV